MDGDKIKILVADDDRVVRRMVVAKLSGLGYDVSEVQDGQEAIDRLGDDAAPDLLITDQLMPRLNGLQLVRTVRDSGRKDLANLPIIMLTSKGGERDIVEGLEAGLDDYVVKPFSPDELAARVRTVLWRMNRPRSGSQS